MRARTCHTLCIRYDQDEKEDGLLIDCDQCVMQHTNACDDCLVTALLAPGGRVIDVNDVEVAALRNLADGGIVAPLRLVLRSEGRDAASG